MKEKKSLATEIYNAADRIAKELEQGKDIIIKGAPDGIKIQSMKISTLK